MRGPWSRVSGARQRCLRVLARCGALSQVGAARRQARDRPYQDLL